MRSGRATSPRPRSSRRRASAGSTSSRRASADRDWLEEHFDFHPLDYEDVYSRNNRPKLDQYDDYVFIVLHFPMFEKDTGRILTAELDLFMGAGLPDHAAEHPAAAAHGDVRALPREGGPARGDLLEGLGLPAVQDRRHLRGCVVPDAAQDGRSSSSGSRTTSSRAARPRSSATSPRRSRRSSTSGEIVRPQRAVLRDLERTKQRYLQEELEIYFDDISDAAERIWDTLENYKEVIEALESTNESVLSHRLNDSFRVLTAASVVLLPLTLIASIFGMNVLVPRRGRRPSRSIVIMALMAVVLVALVVLFRRRGWL